MAPQKDMSMSQSLEPVNATLFETKVFTDKNKLRLLSYDQSSWIVWWAVNQVTSILM